MKTKMDYGSAFARALLLFAMCAMSAVGAPAPSLETNAPVRSCCSAASACAPVSDKSIYQMDAAWTNDASETLKLGSLRGRPQIVTMFFAHCQYACPLLVYQMKQVEAAFPEAVRTNVGFTLVSFDTERDTSAALRDYRKEHDLSPRNWTLLRGSPDSVLDLSALLGVNFRKDAQGQFQHSNLITLLNAEGEIVYQQAGLGGDNKGLIQHIEKLLKP